MWCVASRPPRSSVVGFLEPDHPGSALGGLSAHDEHTSASSGESSASGQESMVVPPANRTSGAAASPKCSTPSVKSSSVTNRSAIGSLVPSLSLPPPSPRHRGVCVRCSQPPGKGTARVWLSQRGFGRRGWRYRVRRSASPETATGPTETPASCRSVAEVSFANGGFVAQTRFGVFGQAMSRYGSRTYGEVSPGVLIGSDGGTPGSQGSSLHVRSTS